MIITLTAIAIVGIHMVKFSRRFKLQDYTSDENQSRPVQCHTYVMAEVLKIKEEV